MSSADIARPPAWDSLEPREPVYRPVGDAWAKRVLISLGRPGNLYTNALPNIRPAPFYRFVPRDSSRELFLKVVETDQLETQLAANRIAEWLAARSLSVTPVLESYPRRLHCRYQLLACRHIDARFASATENDMRAIGRLLAEAHNALGNLPWSEEIKQRSIKRDAMFEQLQQRHQSSMKGAPRACLTSPRLPGEHAQVIHGDLNIGNLLMGRLTAKAHLLDFEDATHNFHNPLVDLAMAIERFVLVGASSERQIQFLGSNLIEAYCTYARQLPPASTHPTDILHALTSRALLLLANTPDSEIKHSETRKFIYLHERAAQHRNLLGRLWDIF